MNLSGIREFHVDYYSKLVQKHGSTLGSVGQTSRSQRKRFEKIYEIGDWENKSVLDVGCGLASFYDFLKEKRVKANYTGVDVTPAMIQLAKESHPDIADKLKITDILTEEVSKMVDYVISVGALNLPIANENVSVMLKFIERMYSRCNVGIAISMTSSLTKKPNKNTFYYNPSRILDGVSSLCQNMRIDHTYLPHDFTLFCYKLDLYS